MAILFANNAATMLSGNITATDTSIIVASAIGFPVPTSPDYFILTLENAAATTREIIKVTSVSGTTFTVTRGQEGTTASDFTLGDKAELRLTAGGLNNIFADITTALQTINGV
jgi:hypothetical protein